MGLVKLGHILCLIIVFLIQFHSYYVHSLVMLAALNNGSFYTTI